MISRGTNQTEYCSSALSLPGATAAEQKVNMNAIYVGVSKSAIATNSGMSSWIRDSLLHNPEVLMGGNCISRGDCIFWIVEETVVTR
jgi:hypothetical protein